MVCGREAGWKCRENGLTKVGPPERKWNGPGRHGHGCWETDRQGVLGTGTGGLSLCWAQASLVLWCGVVQDWRASRALIGQEDQGRLETGSFSVELVTCRREHVRDDAICLMLDLLGGGMGTVLMDFWLLPSSGILETRPGASEICGQGECGRILTCVFLLFDSDLAVEADFQHGGSLHKPQRPSGALSRANRFGGI